MCCEGEAERHKVVSGELCDFYTPCLAMCVKCPWSGEKEEEKRQKIVTVVKPVGIMCYDLRATGKFSSLVSMC